MIEVMCDLEIIMCDIVVFEFFSFWNRGDFFIGLFFNKGLEIWLFVKKFLLSFFGNVNVIDVLWVLIDEFMDSYFCDVIIEMELR